MIVCMSGLWSQIPSSPNPHYAVRTTNPVPGHPDPALVWDRSRLVRLVMTLMLLGMMMMPMIYVCFGCLKT